jgi:hypothetical protein
MSMEPIHWATTSMDEVREMLEKAISQMERRAENSFSEPGVERLKIYVDEAAVLSHEALQEEIARLLTVGRKGGTIFDIDEEDQ